MVRQLKPLSPCKPASFLVFYLIKYRPTSAGSTDLIKMMVATAAALSAIALPPKRHNSLDMI